MDELYDLSERQWGMVAVEQARRLGLTLSARNNLLNQGEWELRTPRVLHRTGTPPNPRADLMAAVLDGGPGTYLGRRAGAALFRAPGYSFGPIEVVRERGVSTRRQNLGRLYTVRYLPQDLTTTVDGIPIVGLPLLLFQLAGFEHPARVERVLDTITGKSPGVLTALHAVLPRMAKQGRNGITLMRELLAERPPGVAVVASGLEKRFARILSDAGEAPMEKQVDLGGHEWIGRVDFRDPITTIIFEIDSDAYHTSPSDRRNDEARDAAFLAAGFAGVQRILEDWIWYDPARVLRTVRTVRRTGRTSVSGF